MTNSRAEGQDQGAAGGSLPAGHPLDVFLQENRALGKVVQDMRRITQEIADVAASDSASAEKVAEVTALIDRWREAAAQLQEIAKHFKRKESLIFAYLEKYGLAEPAQDMWRLDLDICRDLAHLVRELQTDPAVREPAAWAKLATQEAALLLDTIEAMIINEEQGLLPHCTSLFTPHDWAEIHAESARYATCLVTPGTEYEPPEFPPHRPYLHGIGEAALRLTTGQLTPKQLEAIFATLPLDVTFVDADDRIVFYSDWPGRHFSRTPAIIGRPLQHCHSSASQKLLARLLDDFRAGKSHTVESVTEQDGRHLHTRYIAIQDPEGEYLGCLELVHDITRWLEMDAQGRFPHYEEAPAS